MNAGLIAFSSGVLGLALGLLSMGILRRFERERHRTTVAEPALSDGAAQVLAVIGRAYVVVDEVGGVVQASPGAYAMGLVRGHTVLSIELAEMIRTVRHRGIFVEKELEIARGEDESLVIDLRVAPVGNEYILVLADDRTEISRVQREAIEEARDDPESIDYFTSRLHKETKRLTALVRDIIELSRLQSADVIGSGKLVSINSLVAEAVDRSKLAAEAKNITIHTDAHADREVYADPELLGIAVHNLIENAVRYSPEDTRVDVTVDTSHENLLISVTDQGAGISEEDQKRIFERFYRVDPARSRQTGGTGLGLSIVKHVMAQHGGMVTVDSTLGEGSTFTLSLPLAEADHSTPEILESADNS